MKRPSRRTNDPIEGGRQFTVRDLPIPNHVEILGDRLAWTQSIVNPPIKKPSRYWPLREFTRLARDNVPDSEILDFARKWGVLGLVENEDPAEQPCGYTRKGSSFVGWEPLSAWRSLAKKAKAIVDIWTQLKVGGVYRLLENWEILYERDKEKARQIYHSRPSEQKKILAHKVNDWIKWGNIQPLAIADNDKIKTVFGSFRHCKLLGALAYELLLVISSAHSPDHCSYCGTLYLPDGKIRKGRNNYCLDCKGASGREKAWGIAASKYRGRIHRVEQLYASGLTPSEIAKKLGAKTTIDWVNKNIARYLQRQCKDVKAIAQALCVDEQTVGEWLVKDKNKDKTRYRKKGQSGDQA